MDYGLRLQRNKERCDFFKNNNIKVFIKDFEDNYYFAEIIDLKDKCVEIYNFTGKREGLTDEILWIDIKDVSEYKERGDL